MNTCESGTFKMVAIVFRRLFFVSPLFTSSLSSFCKNEHLLTVNFDIRIHDKICMHTHYRVHEVEDKIWSDRNSYDQNLHLNEHFTRTPNTIREQWNRFFNKCVKMQLISHFSCNLDLGVQLYVFCDGTQVQNKIKIGNNNNSRKQLL